MSEEKIIWDAEFNKSVTTYWLLSGTIVCIASIIGIVFLPFWIIIGGWITRRYLASHQCTLTDRTLKVSKGIWVQTEKTVPLDRITDLGIVQGPIMRYLDIEALSVETAGQSSASALVHLAGIKEGRKFRDRVLQQRDLVVGSHENKSNETAAASVSGDQHLQLLTEIRDTLMRMEEQQ